MLNNEVESPLHESGSGSSSPVVPQPKTQTVWTAVSMTIGSFSAMMIAFVIAGIVIEYGRDVPPRVEFGPTFVKAELPLLPIRPDLVSTPRLSVFFANGSTAMTKEDHSRVVSLSKAIRGCGNDPIVVIGSASRRRYRADIFPSEAKNIELAHKRARAALAALKFGDPDINASDGTADVLTRTFRDIDVQKSPDAERLNRRADIFIGNTKCD